MPYSFLSCQTLFVSHEKEFHKVEFSRRSASASADIFLRREVRIPRRAFCIIGKFGELSYDMKKNSTKWNSRAERGCRMATSSMRASVHPARRAFCIIGKFGELSYDIKYHTKNVPESFGDESLYLGDEWFLQSHSTPVVLKFPL